MFSKGLLVAALIGGLVPMAFAQLNNTDKTFAKKLAQGNNYELKAAHMAENMSQNQQFKDYAQMIVTDHTKAGDQLKSTVAATDPSLQLPTDVSAKQQGHLDALKNAGNSFDKKYRSQMISTHRATLKLVENYVHQANDNSQLKSDAQQLIPVFQKHLRDAKKLPKK